MPKKKKPALGNFTEWTMLTDLESGKSALAAVFEGEVAGCLYYMTAKSVVSGLAQEEVVFFDEKGNRHTMQAREKDAERLFAAPYSAAPDGAFS